MTDGLCLSQVLVGPNKPVDMLANNHRIRNDKREIHLHQFVVMRANIAGNSSGFKGHGGAGVSIGVCKIQEFDCAVVRAEVFGNCRYDTGYKTHQVRVACLVQQRSQDLLLPEIRPKSPSEPPRYLA